MSLNYASNPKKQPIRIATAGWCINLYSEIDIDRIIKFMKNNIKVLIKKNLEFASVSRPIFNSQKSEKKLNTHLQRKQINLKLSTQKQFNYKLWK